MKFNRLKLYKPFFITICILLSVLIKAQERKTDPLMFGAEIFIEPGQSDAIVEGWFKTLSEHNMHLTRIRMLESYMKDAQGNWDFTLFDKAFKYAEKYKVKVYANLFPATDFKDIGGFKFPYDRAHLTRIAEYIKVVVPHFKQFKSFYGWVPINEPGGGHLYDPLAKELFAQWQASQPKVSNHPLSQVPHFSFDNEKFLMYYNTWYLKWLVEEIRKYDKSSPIHVNTHQIFDNVAQYDFRDWRSFLTSLGGSAHASWHFGYFPREKYALAMSVNSEIILSGAGSLPWLMTELQAGNNIYSGYAPFCPTKEEIAQWQWISVATGSKGAIFWCLNPRTSGFEAGEWAMLDFQNKPSDRLTEASKIAKVIADHQKLFATAVPLNSKIHILYNRESLWVEDKMKPEGNKDKYEVRNTGAVMKSAISYFEALSGLGLQPTFKELREFSFTEKDYSGETIIFAHQIALPEAYYAKLRYFVERGGTLLIDGLTAFYNENAVGKMINTFPLADLFGGSVAEFNFIGDTFSLDIAGRKLASHALRGVINPLSNVKVIGAEGTQALGVINTFGKGKVIWVPSLIGLGARRTNDYQSLVAFLAPYLNTGDALRFDSYHEGLLMKNLKSGKHLITVVINKNKTATQVQLKGFSQYKTSTVLCTNKNSKINGEKLTVESEDTLVILWE